MAEIATSGRFWSSDMRRCGHADISEPTLHVACEGKGVFQNPCCKPQGGKMWQKAGFPLQEVWTWWRPWFVWAMLRPSPTASWTATKTLVQDLKDFHTCADKKAVPKYAGMRVVHWHHYQARNMHLLKLGQALKSLRFFPKLYALFQRWKTTPRHTGHSFWEHHILGSEKKRAMKDVKLKDWFQHSILKTNIVRTFRTKPPRWWEQLASVVPICCERSSINAPILADVTSDCIPSCQSTKARESWIRASPLMLPS